MRNAIAFTSAVTVTAIASVTLPLGSLIGNIYIG